MKKPLRDVARSGLRASISGFLVLTAACHPTIQSSPSSLSASAFNVQSPTSGATASGTIVFKGQAGSEWVNVAAWNKATGVKIATDATPSSGAYSVSVNTSLLPNGSNVVAVIAYSVPSGQGGGTSSEVDVTVDVRNAGSSGSAASSSSSTGAGKIPSDSTGPQAAHAQDLISRFGVNMHVGTIEDGYTVAQYNNVTTSIGFSSIVSNLAYLGVKVIRDWAYLSNGNTLGIPYWPQIWQATGARYVGAVPGNTDEADAYTNLRNYRNYEKDYPGMFLAYDGMNEADVEGNSLANSQDVQRGINSPDGFGVYSAAHADSVLAFDFSTGALNTLPDQSNYCDFGNAHVYFNPQNQAPDYNGYGSGTLAWVDGIVLATAPGKPVAVTEWGYQTPNQVDQTTQAAYLLDGIMSAYLQGVPYYIWYALYDDAASGSGPYGVFNSDYSPRPAASAIHAMFSLLSDSGSNAMSFTPGKLNYSLGGAWSSLAVSGSPNAGGKQLLLQKSDGSFWLMLDNEVNNSDTAASVSVTLTMGSTTAASIAVYDPLNSSTYNNTGAPNPVQTATSTNKITISLPPHPILVKIVHP